MALHELFRREAVEHRRQRLYGEVVMTLPLTHAGVVASVAAALLLLLALLIFGTYARRETVAGWVRPDRGMSQVFTPDEGVVETLSVAEGQEVRAGDELLSLRLDPDRSAATGLTARLRKELDAERAQLQAQLAATDAQFAARAAHIRAEMAALEAELGQFRQQQQVYERRLALAQRLLDERKLLVQQGFSPPQDVVKQEDAYLAQRQAKEEMTQDALAKQTRLKVLGAELAGLPHDRQLAAAALGEKMAVLDQRGSQAQRKAQLTLTAAVSGRVASVRIWHGETAKPGMALVDIVPQGARLQVELYAPTQAAGFLQVGMPVQLRFDAFPYQKFGVTQGQVVRVSSSTTDPRDLPPGLAATGPVYRVAVALSEPAIPQQSLPRPLQVGMTVKADLLLERRRLIEYLFAPLFGFSKSG